MPNLSLIFIKQSVRISGWLPGAVVQLLKGINALLSYFFNSFNMTIYLVFMFCCNNYFRTFLLQDAS